MTLDKKINKQDLSPTCDGYEKADDTLFYCMSQYGHLCIHRSDDKKPYNYEGKIVSKEYECKTREHYKNHLWAK